MNFGRLKVLSRTDDRIRPSGKKVVVWNCVCECGNKVNVEAYSLTSGTTTSCGCYAKEVRLKANTKHNLSGTRLSKAYYNMLSRCYNPNATKYEIYGGRGITVCDEWSKDNNGLVNFYNWAMNSGYSNDLTLDRINPNGNYEPSNCRWASYTQQNYNRSANRIFEVNGKQYTARELSELYSININTFWGRVNKGMDLKEVLKIN